MPFHVQLKFWIKSCTLFAMRFWMWRMNKIKLKLGRGDPDAHLGVSGRHPAPNNLPSLVADVGGQLTLLCCEIRFYVQKSILSTSARGRRWRSYIDLECFKSYKIHQNVWLHISFLIFYGSVMGYIILLRAGSSIVIGTKILFPAEVVLCSQSEYKRMRGMVSFGLIPFARAQFVVKQLRGD